MMKTICWVGIGAITLLSSCGKKQDQAAMMAAMMGATPSLATITVEPSSIELNSQYPATIKGKTDIDVRPMVSGNIVAVHVDEGATVSKGQVLFTIDQVPFRAAVEQAQAAVNVAQAAVQTAEISAESNRALRAKNIISEHALQISENQLLQAKSQLTQAQAALVTAKKNLSYTSVTAPSAGVVGAIPLREGALASPSGQALTTVSDIAQVYAYFSLTENQLLDLTGSGARSMSDAIAEIPPVEFRMANGAIYPEKGKVATVSGVIDAATGASSVRALFNNPNRVLRSGSTGSIIIPQLFTNVIVVPQKATGEVQGLRYVLTVGPDSVLTQQTITVAPVQDGQNFVVTSGLEPGTRIVVEGIGTKARPGVKINPTSSAAQEQK